MNHYVMYDTPTDTGAPTDPRVLAKTYGRIEAEMLTALLRHRDAGKTYGLSIFIVGDNQLEHENAHRVAVAAFEVDGPDPKDAAEVEILRALLARHEDEGDLRRHMVQRIVVEDARMEYMWKDKMLEWVMRSRHLPEETENPLGFFGDMTVFEQHLAEGKAEEDRFLGRVPSRKS